MLHPEVEHIVQVDVGQQRRGTAALWRSLFTAQPLSFFQHARVQLAMCAGLILYGFYMSLAGQRIFPDNLLSE